MSREYNLGTFLRQTPRASLESYFERKGLLCDVDFFELRRTNIAPVLRAIMALPLHQRAEVEAEFRDIFYLADLAGTRIMVERASTREPRLVADFGAMENHYERAMWLFLHRNRSDDDLFRTCSLLAQMGRLSYGKAKRRGGLPKETPAHDERTCQAMAQAIGELFKGQGKSGKCIVEHHERTSPSRHCYMAFAEDYLDSELSYEGGDLGRRSRFPVTEIGFIYYPEDGVLEVGTSMRAREVVALQEIFVRLALGMPGLPRRKNGPGLNLNLLKDPSFAFPTDPKDGILGVALVEVSLEDALDAKRWVTFRARANDPQQVHGWIARWNTGDLGLSFVDVVEARLQVTFLGEGTKKPTTVTFLLSADDTVTLKDHPQELVVKRYLKEWKIAA